ncbi:MAG: formate--tetrahydrofolate ligase [Candidatus Omnitrophica bacterium]|nr:formate--tetrahydrofolate ligase [Candidatus Omnitrophota bacterium]
MSQSYNEKVYSEFNPIKISDIAKKIGIPAKYLKLYGDYTAKISTQYLDEKLSNKKNGKLILMTSVTPTYYGEGKTVSAIGLSMALNKMGKKSIGCFSQACLGGVFGLKGISTGGGYSQLMPAEELNLNFTGDTFAVEAAQNLCAAALDNSFFWENKHGLDKALITWRRAVNINDRSMRNITIGGGGKLHGISRKSGADLTSVCECMAILSIAKDLKDLRERIGKIVVGYTNKFVPITVDKIGVDGAMALIMKDAFSPNLVQTCEHTPCFVHGSSSGDVSDSSCSTVSQLLAVKLSDFAIVEADFGADLGAEKFFNIKSRQSEITPSAAVINCSVRALKIHSGDFTKKNMLLPPELKREDLSAVDRGCSNLEKQVENLKMYGIPVIVNINRFETDSKKELDVIIKRAEALGVDGIAINESYKLGSAGSKDLANEVIKVCKTEGSFRYLYPVDMPIKNKIERIAKSMYGASEIRYSDEADKSIDIIEKNKLDKKAICMGKTFLSLSSNPKKKGRPRGFVLNVDAVELFAGANYIAVRCDGVNTIPGMVNKPRLDLMDYDVKTDKIKGLL